jgi:hypothetical protein
MDCPRQNYFSHYGGFMMKKLYILPLFLLGLTACETTGEESNSPFQTALARQAEQKNAVLKAKITQIPLIKEEADEVKLVPKTNTRTKVPLIHEMNPIAQTKLETKSEMKSEIKLEGETKSLTTMQTSEKELILRFPNQKDTLTPFEELRIKAFFLKYSNAKNIKLSVGGDSSRQGFEMLKAVQDRTRNIKQHLPSSGVKTEVYAPELEGNTVKIEVF